MCVVSVLLVVFLTIVADDVALARFDEDVLNDVVLAVEDYVSQLAEVLDDVLGVEVAIDDGHVAHSLEVGVLDELLDDRVEYSVELTVLGEP